MQGFWADRLLLAGLSLFGLWFRDKLLDHGNQGTPDIPAAESKKAETHDQLNDKDARIVLLTTDPFCRIGSAATGTRERRSIDLMSTSAAGFE
ncbi:hypothetical protein PROAA_430008 [Candidatus Propionivibrio aalborgensis]|uniref:Uncharacterized protein n=1 Tax=Candidatus Propionivibrio aalborgensis TaxID=1860101 RepID=A0A1A8Y079_9RHOO|nr:hypothetical protein PROAA_430008 [Candidatus Propionivibrio aalborgensis]